jgi:hypothetical protein
MSWRTQNIDGHRAKQRKRMPRGQWQNWLHLVMDGSGLVAGLAVALWWLLR